jgi:dihydroorotase-like cyclic amidohydrolase
LEIALAVKRGRLELPTDPEAFVRRGLTQHGVQELPVTAAIGCRAAGLPDIHNDPFDRIIIATAHAPHPTEAKERPFEEAPSGMLGLETALALAWDELVMPGVLTSLEAFALLSWRPAAIAGLGHHGGPIVPGAPAHLCVFDPEHRWEVDAHRLASKATNTPFAGRTLTGKVRHTVLAGEPVVIDGEAKR